MVQSRSTTAMSIASRVAREIHEEDIDKFSWRTETPHKLSADAEQLIEQYVRPASQSSGHDRYLTYIFYCVFFLDSLFESIRTGGLFRLQCWLADRGMEGVGRGAH